MRARENACALLFWELGISQLPVRFRMLTAKKTGIFDGERHQQTNQMVMVKYENLLSGNPAD